MIIVALFTINRAWKQPKCPSTEEWIKKMWYMNMMKYYLAIKWTGTGSFVETWMDPECVTESEVSQKEKSIIYQCIYVESKQMVQMILFAKQKQRHIPR